MLEINDIQEFHGEIDVNEQWNLPASKELLMHKIHAYPAKFPAFLTPKIVNYLSEQNIKIESIGDIFCGCGTSALESRILGIDYYGYDINPVATLIAKTKSNTYSKKTIESLYNEIIYLVKNEKCITLNYIYLNDRIKYWFNNNNITALYKILHNINKVCPKGKYRTFFLTAFSNILKACSNWLTKSIKPQIDPNKVPAEPLVAFEKQIKLMISANEELKKTTNLTGSAKIETKNILKIKPKSSKVDLVITSPPYVTSYEYADLHQLSTLWLGFVTDYKDLRKGTIGSEYSTENVSKSTQLNGTGKAIIDSLKIVDKSKTRAVTKYFQDLDKTVSKTKSILKDNGHAAFVIGNTNYKGVYIDNAKFLMHSFIEKGFTNIVVAKRKISSKILTPYRDEKGKFSTDKTGHKVYSHEFVIIAKKPSR